MRKECWKDNISRRIISISAVLCLAVGSIVPFSAQALLKMPEPGVMVSLTQAFSPPELRGLRVYPDNPFRLDFILDPGGSGVSDTDLKDESGRLVRYFLASLTIPEKDLWVNLSPYEKDRIVPDAFGQTEMGRDMLAQDYLLKQITASVLYPEDGVGKIFWAKVYQAAFERYGTTDVPVETFNKVWITPDQAEVFENGDKAFVLQSHLKVWLEADYLAQERSASGSIASAKASTQSVKSDTSREFSRQVMREVILPALEKEVNEGKNFVQVRQVYQSLILAAWFKGKVKESLLSKVYVDRKKVAGVNIDDPEMSQKIWAQYVEAFRKGA